MVNAMWVLLVFFTLFVKTLLFVYLIVTVVSFYESDRFIKASNRFKHWEEPLLGNIPKPWTVGIVIGTLWSRLSFDMTYKRLSRLPLLAPGWRHLIYFAQSIVLSMFGLNRAIIKIAITIIKFRRVSSIEEFMYKCTRAPYQTIPRRIVFWLGVWRLNPNWFELVTSHLLRVYPYETVAFKAQKARELAKIITLTRETDDTVSCVNAPLKNLSFTKKHKIVLDVSKTDVGYMTDADKAAFNNDYERVRLINTIPFKKSSTLLFSKKDEHDTHESVLYFEPSSPYVLGAYYHGFAASHLSVNIATKIGYLRANIQAHELTLKSDSHWQLTQNCNFVQQMVKNYNIDLVDISESILNGQGTPW